MDIPEVLTDLTVEALREARSGLVSEFTALLDAAGDAPTEEQLAQAEALRASIERIDGEFTRRNDLAQRAAALRSFSTEQPVADSENENAEAEQETSPEGSAQADDTPVEGVSEEDQQRAVEAEQEVPAAENQAEPDGGNDVETSASGGTATLSTIGQSVPRPDAPAASTPSITLTAAADVPGFSVSQPLPDNIALAQAMLNRMSGFQPPSGDGSKEDLRFFGVASVHKNFSSDLVLDRASGAADVERVFQHAADESRLPGESLTAAAGWCSPSEIDFSLPGSGATTDGVLSLPEVQMPRAGIRYTNGPDWADIYSRPDYFFSLTEAQAIAGSFTKPCATIPCPSFQEVRLDAIGMCVKVEFLMEAAYPENVALWMRELQVAWQHRVNIKNLGAVSSSLGSAVTLPDIGSTAANVASRLAFIADRERSKRRLPDTVTFEVVLPKWVKEAIRQDLSLRNNRPTGQVTDAEIQSLFTQSKLNPQWVRGYQDIADDATDFPATFDLMMYPAGSFIRGSLDVVNLSAVYDAASLAQNVYTGVFFEEGWQVFKRGYGGLKLTLPICSAGRLGALDLTCG